MYVFLHAWALAHRAFVLTRLAELRSVRWKRRDDRAPTPRQDPAAGVQVARRSSVMRAPQEIDIKAGLATAGRLPIVVDQNPRAGAHVDRGTLIKLFASGRSSGSLSVYDAACPWS
jgi:hypothetical protein